MNLEPTKPPKDSAPEESHWFLKPWGRKKEDA
jgi:hypothetical protein